MAADEPTRDRTAGPAPPFDEVWRPGLASQVTGWAAVGLNALLVVVALASALGGDGAVGTSLLVAGVCAVVAAAIWRWTVHPLLGVSPAGITVRNPLRSYLVAWEDVEAVAPTSLGLALRLHGGGRPLVAWAVTKSNLAIRLGRRSRADEVAEYVVGRTSARAGRRAPVPQVPGRRAPGPEVPGPQVPSSEAPPEAPGTPPGP